MPDTRYVKTTGIVLKTKPFSEADKLLTIFTRKLGKIHAIAKGARRMKSRLGGRLDLLNVCSLYLARGRSFYIVSQCEAVEVFEDLKKDYESVSLAMQCAKELDAFTPWEEKQKNLFDLMLHVLLCLNEGLENLQGLRCFFQFKLLSFCGYRPRFEHCARCGREQALSYFIYERGAVCAKCVPEASVARFKLSAQDIAFLHSLSHARSAKNNFIATAQVEKLLPALLEYHYEGRLL